MIQALELFTVCFRSSSAIWYNFAFSQVSLLKVFKIVN